MIIDESSSDTLEPETQEQKSTVVWKPKTITEIQKIREMAPNDYHSIERITIPPAEIEPLANPNMQDTIVVRPWLAIAESEQRGERGQQEVERRRSERNRRRDAMFVRHANYALLANGVEPEPQTLNDALNSSEKDKWKKAWESELTSLAKNNTWVLETLPADISAMRCGWLF